MYYLIKLIKKMEYQLPIEIWQVIVNFCDSLNQIRFCQISKFANSYLRVTDLYNLDNKLLGKLNDEIIKKYPFVVELDACNNNKITNVSGMRSLKKLDTRGNCGINDAGIAGLQLVELNASYNKKITNVSEMQSLKKLDAIGDCGIDDAGIAGLQLVELDAESNEKITNVSQMMSLKKLDASYNCGIDNAGIAGLQLVELNAKYNNKITKKN